MTSFLLASRAAYNDFVLYHNFRHVTDVLQAIFMFLVSLGILPPYPAGSQAPARRESALADLLKPFEGLTLLISAIGHDVGHPGVNNAFLVALNAPLAQLYNDRSVLESFHCAAYSQILRRYWPQAFTDAKMRKLMIDSILATDMGLHFKYMSDLGNLQEKFAHNNRTTDTWNDKILMEYRDLTCGLLIKCADISNVARKFDVAAKWANILTDEFSNQGRMENRLNIPTCLFGGPPVRDDYIKLGQSQIGFMNVFARPLFDAVTDILPGMQFAVDELAANKTRWDKEIAQEKERQLALAFSNPKAPGLLHLKGLRGGGYDGYAATPSPKSGSTEFLLPIQSSPAPTSGSVGKDTKSFSDPHPNASVVAQADEKRRLFNPNNVEFGTPSDPNTPQTTNATSSRRGSADPSLTTILVTQGGSSPTGKDGSSAAGATKLTKDVWAKRTSADSQTIPSDQPLRNGASTYTKQSPHTGSRQEAEEHKSPSESQAALEQAVRLAPDENAAAVTDQKAWNRSDSLATSNANGNIVSPGTEEHGMRVSARGAGKKSQSMPSAVPVGGNDGNEDGDAADAGADASASRSGAANDARNEKEKKDAGRSGFGRFWKKRWRAVSGVDQRERERGRQREREREKEATRSKEHLATIGAGGAGTGTGTGE